LIEFIGLTDNYMTDVARNMFTNLTILPSSIIVLVVALGVTSNSIIASGQVS